METEKIADGSSIVIPLVSVCMITYNHEPYIRQAIEGVLMQRTDFPIELIISEDCSTDNTRQIVVEYAEKYPDMILADLPETNRGMMVNGRHNGSLARGKYIALCEGDDYWTDPFKLQKQVDFLEANPDYSLCFHNAVVKYEGEELSDELFANVENREYSMEEIYKEWLIPTASATFRKGVVLSKYYITSNQSKLILYGDITLFLSLSKVGKLFGMLDIMSVYRKHPLSVTSDYQREIHKYCIHNIEINRIFGDNLKSLSQNKVVNSAVVHSLSLIKRGQIREPLKLLTISFSYASVKTIKKIYSVIIEQI